MVDWVDTSKINADYVPAVYGAADVVKPNLQCFDFWGRIRTSNVYAIGALGTEISATDAKGQSFKANSDFYLTAIQFPIAAGSVAQDLIVRIGETADLSTTYLAEYRSSVIGEAGKMATVTMDVKLPLKKDTQYYIGILKTTSDPFYISINLADIYSEGAFLSNNAGWAMTEVQEYDMNFIVWGSAGVSESYAKSMILSARVDDTDLTFKIPAGSTKSYDCVIYWGDGSSDHITTWDDPAWTHIYQAAGEYNIKISGLLEGFSYNGEGVHAAKITHLHQWGRTGLSGTLYQMFYQCVNMVITATDIPDFTAVTDVSALLAGCSSVSVVPNHEEWSFNNGVFIGRVFAGTKITRMDCRKWGNVKITLSNGYVGYAFGDMTEVMEILGLNGQDVSQSFNFVNTFISCSSLVTFPDVENWSIENMPDATNMFTKAALPTWQYDQLLINWAAQPHQQNVPFNAGNSKYTAGGAAEDARNALIADGWTITDGGPA